MLYSRRWNLLVKLKLRRAIDMTIDEAIERCETLSTKGHIIFSRDPDIAEECN